VTEYGAPITTSDTYCGDTGSRVARSPHSQQHRTEGGRDSPRVRYSCRRASRNREAWLGSPWTPQWEEATAQRGPITLCSTFLGSGKPG
jgi:hypothetical protein